MTEGSLKLNETELDLPLVRRNDFDLPWHQRVIRLLPGNDLERFVRGVEEERLPP